jgi:hypothetical protein
MKLLLRENVTHGVNGGLLRKGEVHDIPDKLALLWVQRWIADPVDAPRGERPILSPHDVPPIIIASKVPPISFPKGGA